MSSIKLENWYQVDFKFHRDPQEVLEGINSVMENLQEESLLYRWFFLWEGDTVRIRMMSKDKGSLRERLFDLAAQAGLVLNEEHPFSDYEEDSSVLYDEEVVKRFANIMSEATKLVVQKTKGRTKFSNYRVIERLSHCLFNNIAGLVPLRDKNEVQFLVSRLRERLGEEYDDDFENSS